MHLESWLMYGSLRRDLMKAQCNNPWTLYLQTGKTEMSTENEMSTETQNPTPLPVDGSDGASASSSVNKEVQIEIKIIHHYKF